MSSFHTHPLVKNALSHASTSELKNWIADVLSHNVMGFCKLVKDLEFFFNDSKGVLIMNP